MRDLPRTVHATLVALCLLASMATPSQAFHGNTLPTVFQEATGRFHWAAIHVTSTGAFAPDEPTLDIEFQGTATDITAFADGFWSYERGELRFAAVSIGRRGEELVVHGPEPLGPIVDIRRDHGDVDTGVAYVYVGTAPNDATLLVGYATDADAYDATLTISAHPNVHVEVLGSGSDGFMLRERAFGGAFAQGPYVGAGATARASATTNGRLFGSFSTADLVSRAAYHGPSGSHGGFRPILDGEPAGTHTFDVSFSAGAVTNGYWAWGLDVDPNVIT